MPFPIRSSPLIPAVLLALAVVVPSLNAAPAHAHPDHHQPSSQQQAPGASEHEHHH